MDVKKVVNFILVRPAFTSKNISTIMLVGVFFGAYVLAGGQIRSVPISASSAAKFDTFGGARSGKTNASPQTTTKPSETTARVVSTAPVVSTTVPQPKAPATATSKISSNDENSATDRLSALKNRLDRKRTKDGN